MRGNLFLLAHIDFVNELILQPYYSASYIKNNGLISRVAYACTICRVRILYTFYK